MKLNLGFTANRSKHIARQSPHPNTTYFVMEAFPQFLSIRMYIETNVGDGSKYFYTIQDANQEIANTRKTFEEKGGWDIENHGSLDLQ